MQVFMLCLDQRFEKIVHQAVHMMPITMNIINAIEEYLGLTHGSRHAFAALALQAGRI